MEFNHSLEIVLVLKPMLVEAISKISASAQVVENDTESAQDWWAIAILLAVGLILVFLSGKIISWWIKKAHQLKQFASKSSLTIVYDQDSPKSTSDLPVQIAVWIFRILGTLLIFGALLAAIMIAAE
ncbi:MAG: hypothetical protein GY861_24110 [bacterium]|nr:hypothetical protein [bacterium]